MCDPFVIVDLSRRKTEVGKKNRADAQDGANYAEYGEPYDYRSNDPQVIFDLREMIDLHIQQGRRIELYRWRSSRFINGWW